MNPPSRPRNLTAPFPSWPGLVPALLLLVVCAVNARLEAGEHAPSIVVLRRLAEKLGMEFHIQGGEFRVVSPGDGVAAPALAQHASRQARQGRGRDE